MIKKLLILSIILLFGLNTKAQYYNVRTNVFGVGYARFNEGHASEYQFKNNQIDVFGSVYGVYLDVSIGLREYSYYDDATMTTWGMNIGYMIPMSRYRKNMVYFIPIVGFQRVGYVSDAPWRDYIDCYGYYHYGTEFEPCNTYFNAGAALGYSHNRFYIQTKITRLNCGLGIGIKF